MLKSTRNRSLLGAGLLTKLLFFRDPGSQADTTMRGRVRLFRVIILAWSCSAAFVRNRYRATT